MHHQELYPILMIVVTSDNTISTAEEIIEHLNLKTQQ